MKIDKQYENRHIEILIQNVPTIEIKCTKVTSDEIIGVHADGEEIHINPSFIMAWWLGRPPVKRTPKSTSSKSTKMPQDLTKSSNSNDLN